MTSFHNQVSQETRNLWSGSSLNLNHANRTATIIKQLDLPVVITRLHPCIHLLRLPAAATFNLALIHLCLCCRSSHCSTHHCCHRNHTQKQEVQQQASAWIVKKPTKQSISPHLPKPLQEIYARNPNLPQKKKLTRKRSPAARSQTYKFNRCRARKCDFRFHLLSSHDCSTWSSTTTRRKRWKNRLEVREPKGSHPPPTVAAALKQAGIHQVHGCCRHLFYLMKLIEITEGGKEQPLFPYNNNTQ